MSDIGRHCVIRGLVQGVGFRQACKVQADKLQVFGTVQNMSDKTVAVTIHGDEKKVLALIKWLQVGPAKAWVEELNQYSINYVALSEFVII